jgi:hypothetical protein
MPYFKDAQSGFYITSTSIAQGMGLIEISEAEYLASQPAHPEPTPQEKLAALDAANTLTQRNLRETVMLMAEAFKQLSSGAVDLTQIPGVAKVYEVEAEAAVLRSQL